MSHLDHHAKKVNKTTKAGTEAERVVWMSRTSDVLGSHMKTDLESYLTLIRRKIQEKCATTADLITQIRRFKIGESGHVTPNEFRFTLIKFGIILPQPLVDRIFNVFDSDRSGTMDFDEFAMWIMNSEFRPIVKKKGAKVTNDQRDTPRSILRKKFLNCVRDYNRVFKAMKKQISFLEFVSDVNRTGMPLNEREARAIFQILDPRDSGFIEAELLTVWAETGKTHLERASTQKRMNSLSEKELKAIVNRAIGRNTRQLENAFSHIQHGSGTKLPFEEFRRCVLNGGGSKNMQDVRDLFMALGGESDGFADIDYFFQILPPIYKDPTTEVSVKPTASAEISTSRADRRLRDSIRKCFKEVKADIEKEDPTGSGYVSAEKLYRILEYRCMPLTFQDFRFIVQQIRKEPGTERIDYHHFLHGYNPLIPPHQLEGLATIKKFASTSALPSATNTASSTTFQSSNNFEDHKKDTLSMSAPFKLSSLAVSGSQSFGRSTDDINLGKSGSRSSAENAELRKIWQGVLRECHRADPERTGHVNRTVFIAALERANLPNAMTAEAMNRLADSYTQSSGLVNYLLLFRNFLNDLTKNSNSVSKVKSLPILDVTGTHPETLGSHDAGPTHPWEFGYKREKHQEHPYWQNATAIPKELEASRQFQDSQKLNELQAMSPTEKNISSLLASTKDKELLLSQYPKPLLSLCSKCYDILSLNWRQIRNQFKKHQLSTQRGVVLTTHFIDILETNGATLSKKEFGYLIKHFRGVSPSQDIVRFDDFLRICMLMKDYSR